MNSKGDAVNELKWVRASDCESAGCAEVAFDACEGGACTEVAFGHAGTVMVRSSKRPHMVAILDADEWRQLRTGTFEGEPS